MVAALTALNAKSPLHPKVRGPWPSRLGVLCRGLGLLGGSLVAGLLVADGLLLIREGLAYSLGLRAGREVVREISGLDRFDQLSDVEAVVLRLLGSLLAGCRRVALGELIELGLRRIRSFLASADHDPCGLIRRVVFGSLHPEVSTLLCVAGADAQAVAGASDLLFKAECADLFVRLDDSLGHDDSPFVLLAFWDVSVPCDALGNGLSRKYFSIAAKYFEDNRKCQYAQEK